ncbi:hypothetical protein C8F04DRAFT_1196534 [Mycena alexandri]|uniref:Uncharacterized protein n=1 Tax=Mycena alexandri TaxID=1745969 RepID=A0AAD6S3E2_9AGAR|nr:hypothetical protein C8F04DRAFT_1196534 [Mycena alexandri]
MKLPSKLGYASCARGEYIDHEPTYLLLLNEAFSLNTWFENLSIDPVHKDIIKTDSVKSNPSLMESEGDLKKMKSVETGKMKEQPWSGRRCFRALGMTEFPRITRIKLIDTTTKEFYYCSSVKSNGRSVSSQYQLTGGMTISSWVDISSNQNSVTEHENTSPAPLVDKNMPTAEFVSSLKIHGRISAKARGKELVVAICNSNTGENFVFRIAFGLEAHCFWIPTEWYRQIVSAPTVPRGSKSQAYAVPDEYIEGPATDRLISIQAAFIRPEYTLLFVDHNVMIQFHLMQMRAAFTSRDLVPTSEFWSCLWSGNHGPVYSLEPEATLRAIDEWRLRILAHPDDLTSIFMAMKEDQSVFNGSGAQEATDQLLRAFISPQMPALYVCMHDTVWARFRKVFVEYDATRMALVLPDAKLPYVSGNSPFRMNNSGHTKYLHHIDSYRRKACTLNVDELKTAHDLGLFIPNAVIQPDGHAEVPSGISPALPTVPTVLRSDRGQGQKTVRVPNIAITMAGNGSGRTSYSPFTAQPGSDWISARREKVLSDVKADVNDTTLGLYSFRIFVDCVWSVQKLKGTPLPRGPRPLVTIGQSNRKRPLAEEIAKTAAPKKRRISLDLIENVDLVFLSYVDGLLYLVNRTGRAKTMPVGKKKPCGDNAVKLNLVQDYEQWFKWSWIYRRVCMYAFLCVVGLEVLKPGKI